MVTKIMNEAFARFGDEFYRIVQDNCPNLTCCYDCHIDDFYHIDGCKLEKPQEKPGDPEPADCSTIYPWISKENPEHA
jgi:hypothetical protein